MKRFLAALALSLSLLVATPSFADHQYVVTPEVGKTEEIRTFCLSVESQKSLDKAYSTKGIEKGNALYREFINAGECVLLPLQVPVTYVKKEFRSKVPGGVIEVWEAELEGFGKPIWIALFVYRTPHNSKEI